MIQEIEPTDLRVGDDVSVEYGTHGCGQGGVLQSVDTVGITILAPGDRIFHWRWPEVVGLTVDRPGPAEECLDYNPDTCSGPVEMWWPGSGHRSWPRCTYHGELRLERAENSLERYADSDVAPDWFDPGDIGERWDDD